MKTFARAFFFAWIFLCLTGQMLVAQTTTAKTSTAQAAKKERKYILVIDPGHGGKDPGKDKNSSKYKHEKELNLLIAEKLGDLISDNMANVDVLFTRENDEFVSLEDRVAFANNYKADFFISIHCDSHKNKLTHGSMSHIHSHSFAASRKWAHIIQKEMKTTAKRHGRGVMSSVDRGYNLFVLQYTNMPGVLVECGFLTNANEEKYLNSDNGQNEIAQALYKAFKSFLVQVPNVKEERGTIYKIQIAASSAPIPLDSKRFEGLKSKVEEHKVVLPDTNQTLYKYTIGREYDSKLLTNLLSKVKEKGFKDAFIVSFD